MSLRVLVISHMYPNPVNPMSGIFVHNELKALMKEGVEVRVLAPIPYFPLYPKWRGYRDIEKEVELDGISVTYVPTWMFPGGLFFSRYGELYERALRPKVEEAKKEFSFDIIHCHTIFPDGYAGGLLKQIGNVPVVATIHGSDIMVYPKRSQAIFNKTETALSMVDYVITVSERLWIEAKKMVPDLRGETVYNGFDPERFTRMVKKEARRKLGISEKGKYLLFVGNLYPVKGIQFLLQAFAQIASQNEDLHLYLVGHGPLRTSLEQQTKELGIQDRVSFMGRRPYEEIPVWLGSADVVVLSSLSEGLPSILLESMGCARPMVATEVGGIPEILKDGETGYLVKPKDVDGLAGRLHKILVEDPSLADSFGEQAYQAAQLLTWQKHAIKMKELYHRLLSQ
ncbi:glycosyltransferase family 4 protein [Thermoflavimicrobium dichotomicum]|uniref:Glycosyltransferase involved in cell wall bisynthesis n=1 Tax=Thermoflavimicrobium dichotomicum TaxID=46223 RepID=A0A1I3K0B1_9BACL|nr:glycosyltransferase family 4 protein [Thermoflavimicrobium dichotomicum]SFI65740.1 Glycosyltransferase involved in cell wall bisynthesis [Thermoflavimicrobium dichotomicum]